jgi:cell division protein FtsW (lipid II flippase)
VFFTAAILDQRMDRIDDLRQAVLPIGGMVAVLAGLILLEPDFGMPSRSC